MSAFPPPPSDASAVRATACDSPCAPSAAPWVLAATILASSMAFIDGTVVNVALPALQRDRRHPRRCPVGDRGLCVVPRGAASRRRVGGRSFRAPPSVPARCGRIRRRIPRMRTRQRRARAHPCPRSAGYRRRAAGPGQPRHHQRVVCRARSRQGHRHLVRRHGDYRGARAGARRVVDRSYIVALPYSSSTSRWPQRSSPSRCGTCPKAAMPTSAEARLAGRAAGDARPRRDCLLPDRIIELGLVVLGNSRVVRGRRPGADGIHRRGNSPGGTDDADAIVSSRTFTGANLLTFLLYAALGGSFFVPLNLIQVQGYSTTGAGAGCCR